MQQSRFQDCFGICKPLIRKLGEEAYDYQFDAADLAVLPAFDEIREASLYAPDLEAHFREDDDIRPFDACGILWLHAFAQMRTSLQQHRGTEPYFPFRQRLEALEHERDTSLAMGIMHSSDDVILLLMIDIAWECPLYIALAEKLMAEINAQMGGAPAPERTREDMILYHELYLALLRYGYQAVCASDYRAPSKVTRDVWLFAHQRGWIFPDHEQKKMMGTWILFAQSDEVDVLWKHVARATSEGLLGLAAKVSTAKPKKTPFRHDFVLYIYDQQDTEQMNRQLKRLGITQDTQYRPPKTLSPS